MRINDHNIARFDRVGTGTYMHQFSEIGTTAGEGTISRDIAVAVHTQDSGAA